MRESKCGAECEAIVIVSAARRRFMKSSLICIVAASLVAGFLLAAAAQEAPRPSRGRPAGGQQRAMFGRETTGLVPLNEMSADDRYEGQDGGLYGGGQNDPPQEHAQAAAAATAKIQPLDEAGKPADDGRIVFISISMSNATQEFSTFKRLADADERKSPRVTIVDAAQGGQAMAEWAPVDARAWDVALARLADASVTRRQVQVA